METARAKTAKDRRELWEALLAAEPSEGALERIRRAAPERRRPAPARSALRPSEEGWLEELAWIRGRARMSGKSPWWWGRAEQAACELAREGRDDDPDQQEPEAGERALEILLKEAGSTLALALMFGERGGLAKALELPIDEPSRWLTLQGPYGDGISAMGAAMAAGPCVGSKRLGRGSGGGLPAKGARGGANRGGLDGAGRVVGS